MEKNESGLWLSGISSEKKTFNVQFKIKNGRKTKTKAVNETCIFVSSYK